MTNFIIRHFSHMTKSFIFKNLNLRKKVNCNFRGNFLKNHFRHLKLYSNPPSWLARSCFIWAPFERQNIEVHIFESANLSSVGTWKFTAKEDLNPQKQVFLLNLRLWPAQKPKVGLLSMGKSLYEKILLCES